MREKGQTEVAKTLETPVFSRGIEILTEKPGLKKCSYLRAVLCGILFLLQDTAGLETVWLQEMADTFQGQTTKVVIAMPGRLGRRRYGSLTVRRTCTQGYPRKMTGKGWQNEKNLDFMHNGALSFNGRLFIRKYDVG